MANVEKLEDKLLELIQHSNPLAIALTGEWGVGKTYLWKKFYEDNKNYFITHRKTNPKNGSKENLIAKKYAYISLFGLDSLDSLKLAIATEVQTISTDDSILNTDISTHFKKLFGFIGGGSTSSTAGDLRFGINIGNKLITNIIMSHLKDTLVCLDDIERKSKNLPMSEVLGLVNYLKNERNCQIIMILHDEESEDKVDFDTQKEKVFDEILVLNDSLSMVKETINDDKIFPIYEKFYQTMGVRNLRFYQRVQKIYQEIIKHSSSLSKLSKEEILRQILIIKLVNDIPKVLNVDMKELETYFSEDGLDDRLDIFSKSDDEALKAPFRTKKDDVEEKLSKFYPNFRMEGWTEVVIELITNIDIDSEKFERLLNQDLINEEALESDREKRGLMAEYRNLNSDQSFNQRLFDNVKDRIDREAFPNLSFYYNILEKNDSPDLAKKFEELVKQYIEERIRKGPEEWLIGDYYLRTPVSPDIFYDFLLQTISNQKKTLALNADASAMSAVFMRFCKHGNVGKDFFVAIQNINKEKFSSIFWQPLDGIDRIRYIRELLEHPAFNIDIAKFNNGDRIDAAFWHYKKLIDTPKRPSPYQPFIVEKKLNEVKRWTLELLQERVSEKPNSSAAVEHLLELTNNLENI
ncbi:P-loop NTPase fold protein [Psychrobacter proteolyticus]|uniref:P-loop NTPase fold protein n=1 Tax=Psychrobacter proteolyticus TaxID=147825 RepID=A0ABV0D5L3_9GAMM